MDTTVYYSPRGVSHTVSTDYTPSGYEVRLDGKIYAMADDRAELRDTVSELVKRKRFSETPPKSAKKDTPPVPAS